MASSHNKRTESDSKHSSFMVFIAGAHSAGKTSVVFFPRKLQNQHDSLYTMGLEIQIVPINNNSVILFDEGGRSAGRALQRAYYRRMTGIIYVVDSSDRTTIDETCNELHQLANEDELRTKPFLILANKQDLPTAMTLDELKVKLNLVKLDGIKEWHLHPTCALRGEGVREGLGWLIDAMVERQDLLKPVTETIQDAKSLQSHLKSFLNMTNMKEFLNKFLISYEYVSMFVIYDE
ncbi:unnamed protein product [Adineta ricciae]|uniref:Uncharacterized protein n=1 Tax=Adineta ricciae TaxID=249248 RepID=A0A814JQL3_ADIRI|nr:unnamed protein product [Adineta ricciae]